MVRPVTKLYKAHRNYLCEASISASVPPSEENILLFKNVDLSFESAVAWTVVSGVIICDMSNIPLPDNQLCPLCPSQQASMKIRHLHNGNNWAGISDRWGLIEQPYMGQDYGNTCIAMVEPLNTIKALHFH